MSDKRTISKKKPAEPGMDYHSLREAGLKHIEDLSSKIWTDYNVHDPGITMLELLCYAITDLGYRTSFPIKDLVAYRSDEELQGSDPNPWMMHDQFLSAGNVLPGCPVSEIDYRKLFIDLEGVKNAWIYKNEDEKIYANCKTSALQFDRPAADEKHTDFIINGLYDVKVELERGADFNVVKEKVLEVYHMNRNLCEDISTVKKVPEHQVAVCADLEIDPEANASEVYVNVMYGIQKYLVPDINFYSLNELLDKGMSSEKIFEGPALQHGFVLDEDIRNSKLRTQVRLSDLIRIIMGIEGVKSIRKILISNCNEGFDENKTDWCISIPEGHKPVICTDGSSIRIFKDRFQITVDKNEGIQELSELLQNDLSAKYSNSFEDLPIPKGNYPGGIAEYKTMQNDLPLVYGVTRDGIPGKPSIQRKSQAKQLKAYLLFYDQILANYMSQLEGIKYLLSANEQPEQTYFTQSVKNLAGIEEIFPEHDDDATLLGILNVIDDYPERKNSFLDHLIARFAENFNDYVLLIHNASLEKDKKELIQDKTSFLREYSEVSSKRARAYNYNDPAPWNSLNVAGLQRRVARLSGINDYRRRDLSDKFYEIYKDSGGNFRFRVYNEDRSQIILSSHITYGKREWAERELRLAVQLGQDTRNFTIVKGGGDKYYYRIVDKNNEVIASRKSGFASRYLAGKAMKELIGLLVEYESDEGMFVIEHPLLRPVKGVHSSFLTVCIEKDCDHCNPLDPYSFRITVVLPGWRGRFANMDFREYLEDLIRKEAPAHILVKICWIGEEQMQEFENIYEQWLDEKSQAGYDGNVSGALQNDFIETLESLHTIYPYGTLHDCRDDLDDNPITLSQSFLGNL